MIEIKKLSLSPIYYILGVGSRYFSTIEMLSSLIRLWVSMLDSLLFHHGSTTSQKCQYMQMT